MFTTVICPISFAKLTRLAGWASTVELSPRQRAVGFKIKRILDLGRLIFIQQTFNVDPKAFQYCDSATESPENILLLLNVL